MLQRGTVTRQSHDLNNSAVRLLIVERELQLGIGGFRLCYGCQPFRKHEILKLPQSSSNSPKRQSPVCAAFSGSCEWHLVCTGKCVPAEVL